MVGMRIWAIPSNGPLSLRIAADVRCSTPSYVNDQIWELTSTSGDPPSELLLPLSAIAPEESRLLLDATQLNMVRNGRSIRRFTHALPPGAQKRGDMVFGMDPGGDLAVVLTLGAVNHHGLVELKPSKVFA